MILIRVSYRTRPGERDRFTNALIEENIPAVTRQEPGNLAYDFSCALDDPDIVYLVEQWESREALLVHSRQPMFRRLGELREELGVERELAVYQAEPASL